MRHLQQYRQIGVKKKGGMIKDKGQVPQGWVTRDNSLYRKFVFDNFDIAIEFINEVAEVCNQMNHHPKWTNIYKTVECWLRTHDAESITEKDIQLAQAMDQIASGLKMA
jgi:4a-hydroxytetrahydrobiopterin dehydratase